MENNNNLPVIQQTKTVAVNGQQGSLVSRGLDVLRSISAEAQDDDNAARQWELGCEYMKGSAAERDYERAYYWFCNAAEQGHAEAQFALGAMYAAGDGVKKDEELALMWYGKAAAQGHAWAIRMLEQR